MGRGYFGDLFAIAACAYCCAAAASTPRVVEREVYIVNSQGAPPLQHLAR